MTRIRNHAPMPAPSAVRCAIYTRKSTEEGLDKDFNSLDAQREAGEAFVKSQTHEGWVCLADRYDDGGFSGGNTERPALQRLLADIKAGTIDVVVTYKVDRLSRSLLDFTKMMEVFEEHQVSFVAFTQQINTATPMGRLMLNVLMSFAQFERELISERTRDKIAAARRKGKWAGGHPILGYDIDPRGFKLNINDDEAEKVRTIFDLYLQHQCLMPVVEALNRCGWLSKKWTTRKGHERGGSTFTKTALHKLLTNVAYAGKIKYKQEVHPGEHTAIISFETWQRVQTILQRNGRSGGPLARNKFGALLKGLLRCAPCGCAMVPSHSSKAGKRYRYYVCASAQKRGWATCPSKSIAASQIEQLIVDQIRCIGQDPALLGETLADAQLQHAARIADLEEEQRRLTRDMRLWHAEVRKLVGTISPDEEDSGNVSRLADIQERIRQGEQHHTQIREQIRVHQGELINDADVTQALAAFDPVWQSLTSHEQARILHLLIEQVNYDGAKGKVSITFRPSGIKALGQELAQQSTETKV